MGRMISDSRGTTRISVGLLFVLVLLPLFGSLIASNAYADSPTLTLDLSNPDSPESVVPAIKIVVLLTVLAVAPALLLMATSFTRILIVLSFVRQALGTQTMPPNQVVVGLSLFLTLFTMGPIIDRVTENSLNPYLEEKISQEEALNQLTIPFRKFMLAETRETDLGLFMELSKMPKPKNENEVSMKTLMPAFMISELKTAFQMGFLVYIPFLIIDMVVSSVLMAMGMMMLPPTVVSLPFKLILFVLVDGWSLIVDSLVKSFNIA
ncbi:MAG: flagellar type III secretion system pore protein FliP [Oligoflexales bacterium]